MQDMMRGLHLPSHLVLGDQHQRQDTHLEPVFQWNHLHCSEICTLHTHPPRVASGLEIRHKPFKITPSNLTKSRRSTKFNLESTIFIFYYFLTFYFILEYIPEYSLAGLMLKLKLQYFGHLM